MRSEVKVGFFVFIAVVALFLMSTQINRFNLGRLEGYPIEVRLGNASGLELYAKVKVNGVEAGHVLRIYLQGNEAYATLFLLKGVRLPVDSSVILAQDSLLGGRYVEVVPGRSLETLVEGGVLEHSKHLSSFEETSDSINQAALEFKELIKEARQVLGEESRENLIHVFANLRHITESVEAILEENRSELKRAIEGVRSMAQSLQGAGDEVQSMGATINAKLPHIVDRVDSIVVGADEVIKENRQPLHDALKSVDSFFSNGNRVINRLDTYLSAVDKSEIEVSMRSEYLWRDSRSKGYASLYYRPNPTRYYMLDVVSSDDYSKEVGGRWVEPKRTDRSKYYLSAQLGKRYGDLLLRGGIIESSAGVGVDYFWLEDRLKATLEAFDFDSKQDIRGENPHLKAALRYTFLKHVDAYFGVDNFLNRESINAFAGVGVRFVDDDLKGLLGAMGGTSSMVK